jgi:hypothetical protein
MVAVRTLRSPPLLNYYFYEPFDGHNCTWQHRGDYRVLAEDAEPAVRTAMQADHPFIPGEPD